MSWCVYTNPKSFEHPSILYHLILAYAQGEVDVSQHRIHRLTIGRGDIRIQKWPEGLKELDFPSYVDVMEHPVRVPRGCRILSDSWPLNVEMEIDDCVTE